MVLKKSEYQNQFKTSVANKNQSAYLENLTFRHKRRDREFIHTPIGWQEENNDDVESSEEETNENFNCNAVSVSEKKNNEPQYQSLAQILDESKAKSKAFRLHKREDPYSKDVPYVFSLSNMTFEDKTATCHQDKDISELCKDGDKIEKLNDKTCEKRPQKKITESEAVENSNKINQEEKVRARSNLRKKVSRKKKSSTNSNDRVSSLTGPKEEDTSCNTKQPAAYQVPPLAFGTKPKRPDRQKPIPRAQSRPMSHERPPFLAYGAGDREDTFTTHRTHNVRSSVDVYGAALRAKIRREEERRRQMEKHKRLAQSTSDLLERLASATPRDEFDWSSEYQKQFHGYEPKMYERSSSRAVISHSAPIRAVHRGGGLLVHVD